jgi:hypothetical protein
MARHRQADHERYIEADNGFGWTRQRSASVLAVQRVAHATEIFGVRYRLEKFRDPRGQPGWYLYSSIPGAQGGFHGEYCEELLLPAIDEASKLIAKADLRGEGYERKT